MPAEPGAGPQRGQPGRPQRLRAVPCRYDALLLRRLRLHGRRLLRPLGRPAARERRPLRRPAASRPRARCSKHVQGVVMIPGRATATDNDLIKRLVRENGALSVGMYWDDSAYSERTDDAGDHAPTSSTGRARGREPRRRRSSAGTTPTRRRQLQRRRRGSRRATAPSSCATAGAATGATDGYFWVSYYDRSFARDQRLGGYGGATSYAVVEDTGNYARVYQYDKLGVTDHWGFGRHARLGRQPVHGQRATQHDRRGRLLRALLVHAGTRSGPAAR